MILTTLFVSALLSVPVPSSEMNWQMNVQFPGLVSGPREYSGSGVAHSTHAHLPLKSVPLNAVGSLGRVGNPFERPVATMQEEQGKPDYILRTGAVFLSALTVAEIEVTRAVIERGGRELNVFYKPFEKHPGALGLVNGAVTGGLGLVALELNRRGKKTEARIFVWTMVAVKAVVFAHNVRELRK